VLRCVVVEDQVMFLQLLVAMLGTHPGVEVVATARSVAHGIEACRRTSPHLLVLDLALPDGDGLAVFRSVSAQPDPPAVIVLSGQASSFVCPRELSPLLRAVVDKTRAYADLNAELAQFLQADCVQPPPGADVQALLSGRELDVYLLIGQGLSTQVIAEQLGLSLRTVETHRKSINIKLGARGGELVRQAALNCQMNVDGVA
jgi:DNA-binding NarL/FixJ family response regulator